MSDNWSNRFRETIDRIAYDRGITVMDVIGPSQKGSCTLARGELVLILRDWGWSYTQIGDRLGGRDHSTIMSIEETARKRVASDG